jgi:hypothetical protein
MLSEIVIHPLFIKEGSVALHADLTCKIAAIASQDSELPLPGKPTRSASDD